MKDFFKIAKEREVINDAIRSFLKERGSVEVETPVVVRSPGMEPNLSPFETIVIEPNGSKHPAALMTSPEYAMKKLLGLGFEKAFTLTKVFRNGEEFGGTHNPEFTLLEWYQQGADYWACMDETEALIRHVAQAMGPQAFAHVPQTLKRFRVRDLFVEHAGVDLDKADVKTLTQTCRDLDIHFDKTDTLSDFFYRLFLVRIEPELKDGFVYDYPVYQAALSELCKDGKYSQRFELYIDGLELCNGFTELTDAREQRRRFEQEALERKALGKTVHPIDETFLELLPSVRTPSFGNALGVDRLHMVLTGRKKIEEVLLFPASEIFNRCDGKNYVFPKRH
ncbi:EF-P lysine aminoacylase GenX [Candidatus Uhrbacteria bacterium]|nr:EF-P lysine aminoacylase GenX [Candidatus Uhrbacteria bacterium]